MKKTQQTKIDPSLEEIIHALICEKSDLIWTLPYDPELQKHIIKELLMQYPVASN